MTATKEPTMHIDRGTSANHLLAIVERNKGDAGVLATAITDMMKSDVGLSGAVQNLRSSVGAGVDSVKVLGVADLNNSIREQSLVDVDRILEHDGQSGLDRFGQALQASLEGYFKKQQSEQPEPTGVNRFRIVTDYSSWTRDEMLLIASVMADKSDPYDNPDIQRIEGSRGNLTVIVDAYTKAFESNPANDANDDDEGIERRWEEYCHGLKCLAELIPEKSIIELKSDGGVVLSRGGDATKTWEGPRIGKVAAMARTALD